jgi:hypothetical protein
MRMNRIGCRGCRFPPEIIQEAIWLYLRFTLSLRDVEDLLAGARARLRQWLPTPPSPAARFERDESAQGRK